MSEAKSYRVSVQVGLSVEATRPENALRIALADLGNSNIGENYQLITSFGYDESTVSVKDEGAVQCFSSEEVEDIEKEEVPE